MIRLHSFEAVRYRGIDGLTLPSLTKANLITGANGIGKTALIEAMWLFTGRYNPGLLWNPNLQRSLSSPLNPVDKLAKGKIVVAGVENEEDHKITLSFEKVDGTHANAGGTGRLPMDAKGVPPVVGVIRAELDDVESAESTSIHVTPFGSVMTQCAEAPPGRPNCVIENTRFQHETPAEYLQRYSDLVREGCKSDLIGAIQMVAEDIEDVEILTDESGDSYLAMALKNRVSRPLHDLGGGAIRLVRLLLAFSAARRGVLFADELENGLHHSIQRALWKSARQWMDHWNVQFVATTHSSEFIDAAIDAFADDANSLTIHKLYRNEVEGRTEVVAFSGDSLLAARDMSLEVR